MNTAAPDILNLANYPDSYAAAEWFSSQRHVPTDAYRASMADGLHAAGGVPAWYIVRDGAESGNGIGVIADDFHKRPDLTPNLCALYERMGWTFYGMVTENDGGQIRMYHKSL